LAKNYIILLFVSPIHSNVAVRSSGYDFW